PQIGCTTIRARPLRDARILRDTAHSAAHLKNAPGPLLEHLLRADQFLIVGPHADFPEFVAHIFPAEIVLRGPVLVDDGRNRGRSPWHVLRGVATRVWILLFRLTETVAKELVSGLFRWIVRGARRDTQSQQHRCDSSPESAQQHSIPSHVLAR